MLECYYWKASKRDRIGCGVFALLRASLYTRTAVITVWHVRPIYVRSKFKSLVIRKLTYSSISLFVFLTILFYVKVVSYCLPGMLLRVF